MQDLESLVNNIKTQEEQRTKSIKTDKSVNDNDIKTKIAKSYSFQNEQPSVPYEKKEQNLRSFLSNIKNDLFKIFTNERGEFQIDSSGRMSFVLEIQEGSMESLEHIRVQKARNHRFTKLDAIDGEALFVLLMNPILKYLQFDSRFVLDDRQYKNMGDNGDFKFGAKRLDIKTRQIKSNANRNNINLLINKNTINKKFNYYALVHREGDSGLEGNQRRLTFVGSADHDKVVSSEPKLIGRGSGRSDLGEKYEVVQDELDSLTVLIADVCLELFLRGGENSTIDF